VFTSGATEAAALVLSACKAVGPPTEHDCVYAWAGQSDDLWQIDRNGQPRARDSGADTRLEGAVLALATSNGETGVVTGGQDGSVAHLAAQQSGSEARPVLFRDAAQSIGKVRIQFRHLDASFLSGSAHKLGGPKGLGVLIVRDGHTLAPALRGGGQEMGRRSGTENVIGIAGFGAAAEAALRDLETGVWDRVERLRNILEETLAEAAPGTIFIGQDAPRLPNTSCFAAPGWKGETQVMQMDLAGFAVSAGSACSSGKVQESRVLRAMGFDAVTASSAIRVSIGPTTTEAELMAFADVWIKHHRRWRAKAA
ncbi:MAG: aminotransferase class V-fold PLP-dependent enzyme, partial [Pseudomonadota bacterium]